MADAEIRKEAAGEKAPLLQVDHLKTHFDVTKGLFSPKQIVKAVDDVSFYVGEGETYGLVGESGCGKSTLGRTLVKIYPATGGKILYKGQDIARLGKEEEKHLFPERGAFPPPSPALRYPGPYKGSSLRWPGRSLPGCQPRVDFPQPPILLPGRRSAPSPTGKLTSSTALYDLLRGKQALGRVRNTRSLNGQHLKKRGLLSGRFSFPTPASAMVLPLSPVGLLQRAGALVGGGICSHLRHIELTYLHGLRAPLHKGTSGRRL